MIIPVGYSLVSHHFSIVGSDVNGVITYGVRRDAVDFGENLVEELHTAFCLRYRPHLVNAWFVDKTTMKDGPVATGPTFEWVNPIQGQNQDNGSSPNVSVLVKKQTALGGRANRGRFYLPGFSEADIGSDGAIESQARSDLQTDMTGFLADLVALDLPMVILHSGPSDPTVVTSLVVDALAATQRRRLR